MKKTTKEKKGIVVGWLKGQFQTEFFFTATFKRSFARFKKKRLRTEGRCKRHILRYITIIAIAKNPKMYVNVESFLSYFKTQNGK